MEANRSSLSPTPPMHRCPKRRETGLACTEYCRYCNPQHILLKEIAEQRLRDLGKVGALLDSLQTSKDLYEALEREHTQQHNAWLASNPNVEPDIIAPFLPVEDSDIKVWEDRIEKSKKLSGPSEVTLENLGISALPKPFMQSTPAVQLTQAQIISPMAQTSYMLGSASVAQVTPPHSNQWDLGLGASNMGIRPNLETPVYSYGTGLVVPYDPRCDISDNVSECNYVIHDPVSQYSLGPISTPISTPIMANSNFTPNVQMQPGVVHTRPTSSAQVNPMSNSMLHGGNTFSQGFAMPRMAVPTNAQSNWNMPISSNAYATNSNINSNGNLLNQGPTMGIPFNNLTLQGDINAANAVINNSNAINSNLNQGLSNSLNVQKDLYDFNKAFPLQINSPMKQSVIVRDQNFVHMYSGTTAAEFLQHCRAYENHAFEHYGFDYVRWAIEFKTTLAGKLKELADGIYRENMDYGRLRFMLFEYYQMHPELDSIATPKVRFSTAKLNKDETPEFFALRIQELYTAAFPERVNKMQMHVDLIRKFLSCAAPKLAHLLIKDVNQLKSRGLHPQWNSFKVDIPAYYAQYLDSLPMNERKGKINVNEVYYNRSYANAASNPKLTPNKKPNEAVTRPNVNSSPGNASKTKLSNKNNNALVNSSKTCRYCKRIGHLLETCMFLKLKGKCFICRREGHLRAECPQNKVLKEEERVIGESGERDDDRVDEGENRND